jgi:hypothetical protein
MSDTLHDRLVHVNDSANSLPIPFLFQLCLGRGGDGVDFFFVLVLGVAGHAIDEKNSLEMIVFVLDGAG